MQLFFLCLHFQSKKYVSRTENTIGVFIDLLIVLSKNGWVASAADPSATCFVIISGILYSVLKTTGKTM